MSFLSRVASVAILAVAVAGLNAPASMAQAAELAHVALLQNAVDTVNIPEPQPVPAAIETSGADLQPGDTIVYPSLAAAVAAHAVTADADDQLRCLATSIYFESKGEPLAGQLAVAQVILNRAKQKRFGDSVCGVVTQPGQFSFVRAGRVPPVDAGKPAYRTALAVAKVAMANAWDSPAPKALFFNARRIAGPGRIRVAAIGNHIFYR